MIKAKRIKGHGVKCSMNGQTFDLFAETTAVVDGMAKGFQRSYKGDITYKEALQLTVGSIYNTLIKEEKP